MSATTLNLTEAVGYHYGAFPPPALDHAKLLTALTSATAALARYDQMLKGMHNSEILLVPLRNQEAVLSSRMEGTITTMDELLQLEAAQDEEEEFNSGFARSETVEVLMYQRAMRQAQRAMEAGTPISEHMIRTAHQILLSHGRGASKSPGSYKSEQNYLADRTKKKILFVPISPEHLPVGMTKLIDFIAGNTLDPLLQTALAHIEFEALHPFHDGNGRIGRMIITLMLWQRQVISAPHFYVSGYLETVRDKYIDKMREVSRSGAWTEWCIFFFEALRRQAEQNLDTTEQIRALYEDMREEFRGILSSQWHVTALDYMFARPIFRSSHFRAASGIPGPTAGRITRALVDRGLLEVVVEASGRRSAVLSFEPLMRMLRV